MTTTPANPLAQLIIEAQAILIAGSALIGPSKADTIKALADVLCSPHANAALARAEVQASAKVATARAAFLPALEAAHNKLAQLRPQYDGMMGMSIDRDLETIRAMLAVAREAAK
jgi:hypothetical protein